MHPSPSIRRHAVYADRRLRAFRGALRAGFAMGLAAFGLTVLRVPPPGFLAIVRRFFPRAAHADRLVRLCFDFFCAFLILSTVSGSRISTITERPSRSLTCGKS